MCKFWSFHVVLHRMADKCTKIYNAGEQSKYVEDNFDCKNMNIYFKYESCKKLFIFILTVTSVWKLNMECSVKLEIELKLKN